MADVNDEPVFFHRVKQAKVLLQQAGALTVHDVYALSDDKATSEWGLYAKKGSSYIRLFATRSTSKSGVTVHQYRLPFKVEGGPLGYLKLPDGYTW